MTWSQEKYGTVFNSFSDNIVGKSLQSKLCQNVPIDVVYTWVNGSDPILLQQLQQYRLQLQEEASKKCPYANCVPSHIITFRYSRTNVALVYQSYSALFQQGLSIVH
jgi:UDP-N-acetylglucosamine-lysosomal-enzyme